MFQSQKNNQLTVKRSKTICFCADNITENIEIFNAIDTAIAQGFEYFLFSGTNKSSLNFAKQVILRKKLQKGNTADRIILIAVIPNENHTDCKSESYRNEYFSILENCDYCISLDSDEEHCCEKYIISRSGKMLCCKESTDISYNEFFAKSKNTKIEFIKRL